MPILPCVLFLKLLLVKMLVYIPVCEVDEATRPASDLNVQAHILHACSQVSC